MTPRFREGEMLHIAADNAAGEGKDVIVRLFDGAEYLLQLLRRTDIALICGRYNRPGELVFDRSLVRGIDTVRWRQHPRFRATPPQREAAP